MIFSENEAVRRWCPHSRSLSMQSDDKIGVLISGYNQHDGGDMHACISTACMAWRWYDPPPGPLDIDLVTSDVVDLPPRRGYCGLSGRPEHGD